MKLLFIYGSPAVGKLTVANEIAKLTGFKVFHNHLSIDCIATVFEFGAPSFFKLIEIIRLETVAEAALQNVNLIYTFCYAKDSDDAHVRKIVRSVEANGGAVRFVLLTAEKEVLEKRVSEESRRQFGKVNNIKVLHELFDKYELFSPVNDYESLIVDNTNLSVKATARKIIKHFDLFG